jgi:hypothetical protein
MERLPVVEKFLVSEWRRVGLEKLVILEPVKTSCWNPKVHKCPNSVLSAYRVYPIYSKCV